MHKMRLMLRRHTRKKPSHPSPNRRSRTNRHSNIPPNPAVRSENRRQRTLHLRNEKNTRKRQMRIPRKKPLHHLPDKTTTLQVLPLRTQINKPKIPVPPHKRMPKHRQRQNATQRILQKTTPTCTQQNYNCCNTSAFSSKPPQ